MHFPAHPIERIRPCLLALLASSGVAVPACTYPLSEDLDDCRQEEEGDPFDLDEVVPDLDGETLEALLAPALGPFDFEIRLPQGTTSDAPEGETYQVHIELVPEGPAEGWLGGQMPNCRYESFRVPVRAEGFAMAPDGSRLQADATPTRLSYGVPPRREWDFEVLFEGWPEVGGRDEADVHLRLRYAPYLDHPLVEPRICPLGDSGYGDPCQYPDIDVELGAESSS